MNFPSIRIEGAILSPDILDRLEETHGQRPADFGCEPTVKVKDEIVRAWADAQDYWRIFNRKLEALKVDSPATTETRNHWIVPLLGLLGYQVEFQAKSEDLNGKLYPISHRITNRNDTIIHIVGCHEPAGLDRKPDKATLRMSAHAMVQEYLNLTEQLYGFVTNGRVLRLLRNSSRLVKLTYLEFDLDRIFTDGLFADFALFFRLLHVSRLPVTHEAAAESIIERYHQDSLDAGARIRDGLSRAVEEAILTFANGFLFHPDNKGLRDAIASGTIKADIYYRSLLHLIYRTLFLLVIEERNLVYPLSPDMTKRDLYYQYYSLQRLRRLSEKRHLADRRHGDLWLGLLATFWLFEDGGLGYKLGIAPLDGDLFSPDSMGSFRECALDNETLMSCFRSLCLYQNRRTNQLIRVNYAALNVEEFGSVYEGLLEYEPIFTKDGNRIEFAFAHGDERAATGSHYTPDDLVQPLLRHSLDHLITEKLMVPNPEKALLSLRVADISCGSGHILLAAARRIATELAIVRTGEEQPSPTAFRTAVRDVIRTCIYGVDLNPLAVELCKVALWLEAHTPGEPLNFLDHHIKCGNAIVGFDRREELERGVPEEAFAAMPGDDKEIATFFRKRNRKDRKNATQIKLDLMTEVEKRLTTIHQSRIDVSDLPERTPADIAAKKQSYYNSTKSTEAWFLDQIASIPIAQFYIPKTPENQERLITDNDYRLSGHHTPQGQATGVAWALKIHKRFFHWFLEFPEVIEQGGFDCILGNPPYLGGQDLSGTYGYPFCHYVKWEYAPAGLSDLVVYFVRRIYNLLRPGGFTAFITTNSIKDGDVRKDGLEQILAQDGCINFAVRGIKWPGRANLVVSLVGIHKGKWQKECFLDGKGVPVISAFFEDTIDAGQPVALKENADRIYQGSIPLGDGFFLTPKEADQLLQANLKNRDVIFKTINGEEINNNPEQAPQRRIISFHDWSEERSRNYKEPFAIVEEKVKPVRLIQKDIGGQNYWWRFLRPRNELYSDIHPLGKCFVAARITKYLNFSAAPTDFVFLDTIYVLTTNRWDLYSIVQSSIHEIWARKYSGALETRLRYSPSDCFETFPFPEKIWDEINPTLAAIGERYHEHRRTLMLNLWLGLTDIYNLFHTRNLTPEQVAKVSKKQDQAEAGYKGILRLREYQRELDNSILIAYGWSDLLLGHQFTELETLPENDRIRYTVSPEARKEILKRLLTLNLQRGVIQAAAIEEKPIRAVKRKRKLKVDIAARAQLGLDYAAPVVVSQSAALDPLHLPDGAWTRPLTNNDAEIGAILVAVLKAICVPTPARHVRVAALLAAEPWLLTPTLSDSETAIWKRLIGPEATPQAQGTASLSANADYAWGNAVRQLRSRGQLVENLTSGTWGPGPGLDAIMTDGWPDGRALMVLDTLKKRSVDEIVRQLPDKIRRWIDAKAA